jgi:cobalt/nickel transport system permease protein
VNRDRVLLLAYLAVVVAVTLVHRLDVLAGALVLTAAAAGRDAPRLARRTATAVLFFTATVTLAYVAAALWRGRLSWYFVVLLNLRVFLLSFLSMLFASRINAFRALSFSRTLMYVLTLAYSQALAFRRLHDDFRLAFTSRSVTRPRARERYRHAASTASFFLRRALNETGEITMALTSRGFFDDRG